MYVCKYVYKFIVDIYLLCMIKFRVRWCTRSMWTMLLPYGKLSVFVLSPPLSPFYFVFD